MWDNASQLNRLSDVLFAAAALMVLYGLVRFAIVQPVFALKELHVLGSNGHVSKAQVEALAKRDVQGTFFTMDIERLRNSFEKLPWVRKADVRRQWPNRVDVIVEEHQPLARWGTEGKEGLVNVQGEVFAGAVEGKLPEFGGPQGSSSTVMAHYELFKREFAAIGREPVVVRMSPRGAWHVRLDNGMTLEVGRDQVPERVARFLAAYPRTIAPLGRNAEYVDLRYPNGFAVRVRNIDKATTDAPRNAPRA
jgi:cell division protein FtsQ